jgi:hypothetical protein
MLPMTRRSGFLMWRVPGLTKLRGSMAKSERKFLPIFPPTNDPLAQVSPSLFRSQRFFQKYCDRRRPLVRKRGNGSAKAFKVKLIHVVPLQIVD